MTNKTSLAKISRPRLFGVVPRERLFELLEGTRSLIWLCAPPGAGKTTLVASYLEAKVRPSIWYQIDASDTDPAAFFLYLSRAAHTLRPQGEPPLPQFVPDHLADLKGFARHFFRAFFAQMPAGLILVLDNYHDLEEDAALHDGMHQCIAEVPPENLVIVASRAEPPKQFIQWVANGAMLSVGWDQLKLTFDEVREICSRRGIADEWLIQALHHQADGWAAGLTLMLERLGHFDGQARELPNDTRESVFNYFASLIFDQLSRDTQQTLLALSLMPYVTPSLAVELSAQDGAPALLESFYRRRLFTDRRAGVEPVYQFHGLFRDFLKDQARQRFSVAAYDALIVRSAYAMENMRETDVAMELWISAGYWDQATRLVLREANAVLASGRAQTLTQWVLAIPESQRAKEPWLLYWLGCAQHQTAPDLGLSTLDAALVQFRDSTDRRGHLLCLATLLSKAFVGYAAVVAMNRWLDELLEFLQTPFSFASAEDELRVRGVLSFALFYVRPWHPATAQSLQRVEELLLECTDARVKLSTAAGAVAQCAWTGDIERGERILAAVESGMDFDSASPSEAAWCLSWFGYLRFIQARYEEALAYIRRACAIAEQSGLRVALRETLYQRFMVEFRALGWPAANATLEEMEAMPPPQRPLTQSLLYYYQARRATHQGRKNEAARLAALSHRAVLRTGSVFQEMFFSLASADILLDDARIEEARPLVARLDRTGCGIRLFSCCLAFCRGMARLAARPARGCAGLAASITRAGARRTSAVLSALSRMRHAAAIAPRPRRRRGGRGGTGPHPHVPCSSAGGGARELAMACENHHAGSL